MNFTASSQVWAALAPVFLLILAGGLAARMGWFQASSTRDLSGLVFFVFMPALLFRTMSQAHWDGLELRPLLAYYLGALLLFGVLWWRGDRGTRAATLAMTGVFSNTIMIGVPLVTLAYGEAGLVTLLTVASVHAMVLLTVGTVALEWGRSHEAGHKVDRVGVQILRAARSAVIHPVPIPILAGLAFSALGWRLPGVVDQSLQWLGSAASPLALVMLGVSTFAKPLGGSWQGALRLVSIKLLLLPVVVGTVAVLLGVRGLPLTVLVVTAAMPVGANVFIFSQRYQVAQDDVTAAVSLSTALAAVTVSAWMLGLAIIDQGG